MIRLEPGVAGKIRKEGEAAYPNECCGFLLGEAAGGGAGLEGGAKTASCIIAVDNRRMTSEQYHRFVILPEDFLKAEKEAARRDLDITGIYHSHPDCPPLPSEYDREHALPFYSYLIVSVNKGKADEIKSWILRDDRTSFEEEQICQ